MLHERRRLAPQGAGHALSGAPDRLRIFLVRHGESVGNLDREVYRTLPDHQVGLSPYGQEQAVQAGIFLRAWLEAHPPAGVVRLRFSPYQRTRGTADGLLSVLGRAPDGPVESARPDLHLIEQRFGLFDGLWEEEMRTQLPREHAHYTRTLAHAGRFWAKMPEGDSPYDVAVRVQQSFDGIHREYAAGLSDLIVVAHGVSIRAFLMTWLGLDPAWYESERNPQNASIRLVEGSPTVGWTDHGYLFPGFPKRPEVLRNEGSATG